MAAPDIYIDSKVEHTSTTFARRCTTRDTCSAARRRRCTRGSWDAAAVPQLIGDLIRGAIDGVSVPCASA